jgi:hypothetical protein
MVRNAKTIVCLSLEMKDLPVSAKLACDGLVVGGIDAQTFYLLSKVMLEKLPQRDPPPPAFKPAYEQFKTDYEKAMIAARGANHD